MLSRKQDHVFVSQEVDRAAAAAAASDHGLPEVALTYPVARGDSC